MRAYTDIFTSYIFATKDYTFHNLKDIIRDKDLVLLRGNRDSSVIVMDRIDYNNIIQKKIVHGTKKYIYEETADNTLIELKNFQDFLYRDLKDYKNYDDMKPVSNQLAKLYGTAKTDKSENLRNITSQKHKCC